MFYFERFYPVLKEPIDNLKGIGKKRKAQFNKLGFYTIGDILLYFPKTYIDRSNLDTYQTIEENKYITVFGEVQSVEEIGKNTKRLRVLLYCENFFISLIFFKYSSWLKNFFQIGDKIIASGKAHYMFNMWQIVHPEFEKVFSDEELKEKTGIYPVYRITDKMKSFSIDSKFLSKIIKTALDYVKDEITEYLPESFLKVIKFLPLYESLKELHFPTDRENYKKAILRMKFEEIYPLMFLLEYKRQKDKLSRGIRIDITENDVKHLYSFFPFEFTNAQKRVVSEILKDIKDGKVVNRLIQGDVGSGKTAVAFFFMILFTSFGYQTVMMAPTEVLARQHYQKLTSMLFGKNFPIYLLIGDTKKKEKDKIKTILKNGDPAIVIGTHALIEDDVEFSSLALAIVDEQHRFGVEQRGKLIEHSKAPFKPHLIYMTATPIPRTLTQTLYGDLDVSIIDEMPPGRKPVKTYVIKSDKIEKVYNFLKQELKKGRQAYFIYPLIEENERLNLKSAIESANRLNEVVFKEFNVGLLHGKMKSEEKERILNDFRNKKYDILVSTTVIEVGIDVPNATVMVIENAERFGLSQLHQLRGRVGRGEYESYCFLITSENISPDSLRRLYILEKTNSGFEIAEEDLKIRGPGELTGVRQSGLTEFRFINLIRDGNLIAKIKDFIRVYIKNLDSLSIEDKRFSSDLIEYLAEEYKDKLVRLEA